MLLACCFREPNKKKTKKNHKNNGKYEKIKDSNLKSLISAPIISTTTTSTYSDNSRKNRKKSQEKLVPSGKEDGLKHSIFVSNQQSNDKPPSSINCQNVDLSRMFASAEDLDGSSISISNQQKPLISSFPSFFSNSSQKSSQSNSSSYDIDASPPNLKTISSRNTSGQNEVENCENIALPAESELKIRNKDQTGKNEETKKLLEEIREEYENKIENLKHCHRITLENERETFQQILCEDKENHIKDLEKAKTKAKNEANETICHLNKQIVFERAKMFNEQQENSKNLEEEFRMKEDRLNKSLNLLNQSLILIEEREQAWQNERAEILKEVRRLKEEATQMAKMLAMDYEEDNLGKEKRRSLTQEVYSLQLVVEMRTGEVKNLREQLARSSQQLEQAEMGKERLRKATSKIEDLEEQIKIKSKNERQLSVEKVQMEMNISNTNKEVDRMKQNVESMQWRIRNKFDLPVQNLTPLTSEQQNQNELKTSLSIFVSDTEKLLKDREPKRTTISGAKFKFLQEKTSTFSKFRKGIEPNNVNEASISIPQMTQSVTISSDLSPCSEGYNTSFTDDDHPGDKDSLPVKSNEGYLDKERQIKDKGSLETIAIKGQEIDNLEKDADSHDEGVEDISSDYDNLHSPRFQTNQPKSNQKDTSQVLMRSTSHRITNSVSSTDDLRRLSSSATSPVKERMPSRFSFGI